MLNTYDRNYVLNTLSERCNELHTQYRKWVSVDSNTGAVRRCELLKEYDLCSLVLELLKGIPIDRLSESPVRGLEKLCEPRRLR